MSRRFDLTFKGRALKVCILPVDEAWEFWLCERGRRLALAGRLAIDDAVAAWRDGDDDPFLAASRSIADRLERGDIALPPAGTGPPCEA